MKSVKSDTEEDITDHLLLNFKSKVVNFWMNIFTPILIILTLIIIYVSSIEADLVVLWFINLSYGDVMLQNSTAKTIFDSIKIISALGTFITFGITVMLLVFLYSKDFLKISWGTKEKETIKFKAIKWIEDTGTPLLNVIGVTVIFIVLLEAIALALWIASSMLSSQFINAAKIFTALAITMAYIITLATSLFNDGKDYLKLSQKTGAKEVEK